MSCLTVRGLMAAYLLLFLQAPSIRFDNGQKSFSSRKLAWRRSGGNSRRRSLHGLRRRTQCARTSGPISSGQRSARLRAAIPSSTGSELSCRCAYSRNAAAFESVRHSEGGCDADYSCESRLSFHECSSRKPAQVLHPFFVRNGEGICLRSHFAGR